MITRPQLPYAERGSALCRKISRPFAELREWNSSGSRQEESLIVESRRLLAKSGVFLRYETYPEEEQLAISTQFNSLNLSPG